jgi:signal transduction histidine kinase
VLACIAVPMHDPSGRLVGVLMAELDSDHPSLGILPSADPSSGIRAQFLSGNSSADTVYTTEHRTLLADLIQTQSAGYRIHETAPGARIPSHVVAYAPVTELPSWGITVEQPQDLVLAMPRRLELRLALSGLAALLLAAAVAWLDVRRVVGPLKRLTVAAERFADGQLDEPASLGRTPDRSDELGVLARAFESMRQQLRASLAEVAEWNRSALLEPDRVIALVVVKARDLFGAEVAGLGLIGERGGTVVWHLVDGAGAHRRVQFPPGDGPFAPVMELALPVVISHPNGPTGEAPISWPPEPDLRSALAVPLQSQGRTLGVLMVGSRSPRAFGKDQLALLSRLAAQAAVALENARLYRQTQSEAALEERERIAREMHDGLGQVLGYVNTKTLAVARLLDVGRVDEARAQVAQLEAVAKEVYADVREAILGLRTTLGPEHDFLTALREYLEGYERQSGIEVQLEVLAPEGRLALPFAAEIQLLRIAQEALTNVRKHAQASRAVVRLEPASGELQLAIEDDGRGFDPAHQTPEGWPRFGLQTMQERAKAIGGRLRVERRASGGTRVVVWVPQEAQEGTYESASSLAGR